MKVCAVLNNYQIGSYPHRVFEQKIYNEIRIDKYHTIVFWDLEKGDKSLLIRVLGNREYRVRDVEQMPNEFFINYFKQKLNIK